MVDKYTRHFGDVLLAGGGDPAVSGYDAEVPVDDHRIDKAELAYRSAELRDLLLGVSPRVVHIGYQPVDWDELHFGSRFHRRELLSGSWIKAFILSAP